MILRWYGHLWNQRTGKTALWCISRRMAEVSAEAHQDKTFRWFVCSGWTGSGLQIKYRPLKAGIILHDTDDKETRKQIVKDFKKIWQWIFSLSSICFDWFWCAAFETLVFRAQTERPQSASSHNTCKPSLSWYALRFCHWLCRHQAQL